ncbi:glycoside hydrolase family 5 protein [Calocera viscosa TUFC12733]|uniref:mannan endo-1,4-beta-mannosidase n=1 Tax=Calocera viscosa (strain TUFC12733) TaxID=1330018 RepID=A0A167H8U3_CALVF|nr:glycoside hydrolase family 5 protein [Calocera viscosa TUFC12733]
MHALGLLSTLLAAAATVVAAPAKRYVPPGFVTTNGETFELDGRPFNYVGTNSYWLPLLLTEYDVDLTFQNLVQSGYKVLRTWGFNALNESEVAGALESGLTYYQVWNGPNYTVNYGPQGLERLDNIVSKAEQYGIKLIVTFTNNWVGYGGSDLYVQWMAPANSPHDTFYTDPTIIAAYQEYVNIIVQRYKSSPAIFSWELINEARCASDSLPASATCAPATLTTWYQQQSDYVRSLDPYHMINAGGEGQFDWTTPEYYWYDGQYVPDYNYDGGAGESFDAVVALPNIDFGGYHMYPETWYPQFFTYANWSYETWGANWIQQHATAAHAVGKPIIIEEFGSPENANKTAWYPTWVETAVNTKHAGIMPWQFGQLGLTEDGGYRTIKYTDQIFRGASPNDSYTFYSNETALWSLFTTTAALYNSMDW